jgi:hypothetical protein
MATGGSTCPPTRKAAGGYVGSGAGLSRSFHWFGG